MNAPVRAQELERAIRRGEAETRLQLARALVQVRDREAAARLGHGLEDGTPLRRRADAGGEGEVVHGRDSS